MWGAEILRMASTSARVITSLQRGRALWGAEIGVGWKVANA